MKYWTVTMKVASPHGGADTINYYTGAEAPYIAADRVKKICEAHYRWAEIWVVEECAVHPMLANALDRFMSEEYDADADTVRDSLKPNKEHRISLLYSTVSLRDWKNKRTLTDDLDIQIYLNYLTGAYEIYTAAEWELAYVDGYYTDDELARDFRYLTFDDLYNEYADKVREWWVKHPKELKEWYDEELSEGFES